MVVYQRVAVFVLLVKCAFLFAESWENGVFVWRLLACDVRCPKIGECVCCYKDYIGFFRELS